MNVSAGSLRWILSACVAPVLTLVRGVAADEEISPFLPPSAVPTATAAATDPELDALQFSGLSISGEEQRFNFVDNRSRKSFWVSLGGGDNGITVESYNAQTEQVVVRRGARTRTLSLRKATLVAVPVSAPSVPAQSGPAAPMRPSAPPPTPGAPVAAVGVRVPGAGVDEIKNPKTPEEVQRAEFEARMLVSDLLEISMQERARQRALREGQARGGQPPPANAVPAPAPVPLPAPNR